MILNVKIRLFLILLVFALALNGCKKSKYDVIPYSPVNFSLDLNDPEFFNLNSLGGSDTIDAHTNNWGINAAGFDGNGIIIYSTGYPFPNEFYAFDRTCPHDYEVNGLSIKVSIKDIIYAECPKCKTRYALPANGTPSSGIGRYPLKNYKTSFDGRYIHVWN
jgi:hypothetical protein